MTKEAMINGSTRLFGIVGDPIVQVKTPEVMTALFRAQGMNAVMLPLQVAVDDFEATMRGLMALRNLDGLVVTVPHKVRAMALADRLQETAQQVGALNVMRRTAGGEWIGEMFDGEGLVRGMRANGFHIAGARIKQMGAGGSGAAVAMALARAGAAKLTIHDPDLAKAEALVERLRRFHLHCRAEAGRDGAEMAGYDLLVNCSPIGMRPGDGLPAPFGAFDPQLQVVDIIMHPEETPLLAHARRCGCLAMNGRPMLEGQTRAFAEFFGAMGEVRDA